MSRAVDDINIVFREAEEEIRQMMEAEMLAKEVIIISHDIYVCCGSTVSQTLNSSILHVPLFSLKKAQSVTQLKY